MASDGTTVLSGGSGTYLRLYRPDGASDLELVHGGLSDIRFVGHHPELGLYAVTEDDNVYRRTGSGTWTHLLDRTTVAGSLHFLTVLELGSGIVALAGGDARYLDDRTACEINDPSTRALSPLSTARYPHLGGETRALVLLEPSDPSDGIDAAWLHLR